MEFSGVTLLLLVYVPIKRKY